MEGVVGRDPTSVGQLAKGKASGHLFSILTKQEHIDLYKHETITAFNTTSSHVLAIFCIESTKILYLFFLFLFCFHVLIYGYLL